MTRAREDYSVKEFLSAANDWLIWALAQFLTAKNKKEKYIGYSKRENTEGTATLSYKVKGETQVMNAATRFHETTNSLDFLRK